MIKANTIFMINHHCLSKPYIFDIPPYNQYNTDCFCLAYEQSTDRDIILKSFYKTCQLEKQEKMDTLDYETLLAKANEKDVTLDMTCYSYYKFIKTLEQRSLRIFS